VEQVTTKEILPSCVSNQSSKRLQ